MKPQSSNRRITAKDEEETTAIIDIAASIMIEETEVPDLEETESSIETAGTTESIKGTCDGSDEARRAEFNATTSGTIGAWIIWRGEILHHMEVNTTDNGTKRACLGSDKIRHLMEVNITSTCKTRASIERIFRHLVTDSTKTDITGASTRPGEVHHLSINTTSTGTTRAWIWSGEINHMEVNITKAGKTGA